MDSKFNFLRLSSRIRFCMKSTLSRISYINFDQTLYETANKRIDIIIE